MNFRLLILPAVISLFLSVPASSQAVERAVVDRMESRQAEGEQIQKMPIHSRPNRVGHVYGNNVRRLHYRTMFVNRQRGNPRYGGF